MKLLSILIPHYNSAKALVRLLDSIPAIKEIEIIVVDDKSNKSLVELEDLIKSRKYRHVTFIKNETSKKGAGVCRNISLEKATGKWLLFADSDDYFIEGFYAKIRSFFKTNYDVVFFKPTSAEERTGYKSDRHLLYEKLIKNYLRSKDIKSELFLKYLFVSQCSKLFKTNYIRKHKIYFDETLVANDAMFSIKTSYYTNNFFVSNGTIYCITKNTGTLTTNLNKENYFIRLSVYIRQYTFLKNNLEKKQWALIKPNGISKIVDGFKYKLGIKDFIYAYRSLNRSSIPLFTMRLINPFRIIRGLFMKIKKIVKTKKYVKRTTNNDHRNV